MRHFPLLAAIVIAASPAAASSLKMIYQASDFPSQANLLWAIPGPFGQVISGAVGGAASNGQLFVLKPAAKGTYTKTVLHLFASATQATDGAYPTQDLLADKSGNVWGTSSQGGANNTGTVFELIKPATKTGSWTYRVAASLPSFKTSPGGSISLVFDRLGNLYGTSAIGCSQYDCGSVFKVPAATLAGGTAPAKVLLDVPPNTSTPAYGLTIDTTGNLYGSFYGGHDYPSGAVFQISPGAKKTDPYTFQVIHSFCSIRDGFSQCVDGANPQGGVTYSKGVLYGTTSTGGAGYTETNPNSGQPQFYASNGVTFSLTPPATAGGAWAFNALHTQQDYVAWNTGGLDYRVQTPQAAPAINSTGALVIPMANGGVNGGLTNYIYGAVISVDPTTGADKIVSNEFAVENGNLRSGPINNPYHPFPLHLDAKGRIYGNADSTYDTTCTCYHYWGDIYLITP